jgi:hypothetical protein
MTGSDIAVAVGILVVFLGGIVLGVIVMVSAAIRREERMFSLTGRAPDAMTSGARLLTGACCRDVRQWPSEEDGTS